MSEEETTKVDDIRHKLLGAIHHEDWCHFVDDLIFAVREECAQALRKCSCGHDQEILWCCEHCGQRCTTDAYSFEAAAEGREG